MSEPFRCQCQPKWRSTLASGSMPSSRRAAARKPSSSSGKASRSREDGMNWVRARGASRLLAALDDVRSRAEDTRHPPSEGRELQRGTRRDQRVVGQRAVNVPKHLGAPFLGSDARRHVPAREMGVENRRSVNPRRGSCSANGRSHACCPGCVAQGSPEHPRPRSPPSHSTPRLGSRKTASQPCPWRLASLNRPRIIGTKDPACGRSKSASWTILTWLGSGSEMRGLIMAAYATDSVISIRAPTARRLHRLRV